MTNPLSSRGSALLKFIGDAFAATPDQASPERFEAFREIQALLSERATQQTFEEWWEMHAHHYYASNPPPKKGLFVDMARDAWNAGITSYVAMKSITHRQGNAG